MNTKCMVVVVAVAVEHQVQRRATALIYVHTHTYIHNSYTHHTSLTAHEANNTFAVWQVITAPHHALKSTMEYIEYHGVHRVPCSIEVRRNSTTLVV